MGFPGWTGNPPGFKQYFAPMLFLLSKIIPLLLFPVGFACIAGVASAGFAWFGRKRAAVLSALAGAGVLYLASLWPVSRALLRGLEGRYSQALAYPPSPAIVVLGGAGLPRIPPRLHPETNAYGDRPAYGAMLFRKGLAPRIVLTGGTIPLFSDLTQSEASVNAEILAEYFGIDTAAMVLAEGSRNTREDALRVRGKFDSLGLPREIILVTSAAHMPRSVALFRKQGFVVHPAPTDFRATKQSGFKAINLLPDEGALATTCYALHEHLGYAAYRMLGWL